VKEGCIPSAEAAFVAQMEAGLDVYEQPYNAAEPVVCFAETSQQRIQAVRLPTATAPGHVAKQDFEYQRNGTRNLCMCFEPLAAWRHVHITQQRTAQDFAHALQWLVETVFPNAHCIHLVLDNLFAPPRYPKPSRLLKPDAFSRACVFTPNHGSWLNMPEIELSVLSRAPLNQRIPNPTLLNLAIGRFEAQCNKKQASVNSQFTTADPASNSSIFIRPFQLDCVLKYSHKD